MIPQKFIEFIEEIVADGNWEYGDGASMTEDAKIALAEIQRWHNLTISMQTIVDKEWLCHDCSNKLLEAMG